MSNSSVVIIGGGVAGMSAAHELMERGFDVTVLERATIPGGKARSVNVPGSGTGGRRDLPGEHGFRFFPGFYKHLPDTMKRIPYGGHARGVFDNLVAATRLEMAQVGMATVVAPAGVPTNLADFALALADVLGALFGGGPALGAGDLTHFAGRLLVMLSSCDARRYREYETTSWWDFAGAASRSKNYQLYLADGLSRTLLAARATRVSARVGGTVIIQLLLDLLTPGAHVDRVLNGPTNDVWIGPCLTHLLDGGVDYRLGAEVTEIRMDGSEVGGVEFTQGGVTATRKADHYLAAVPKEVIEGLVTPALAAADPRLASIALLETEWMNGVMFYLHTDPPSVRGHTIYIDSPWALTSISQQQFWPGFDLRDMGDGSAAGILSVDVSDWGKKGGNGRTARQCTRTQFIEEVRRQLVDRQVAGLDAGNLATVHVDADITFASASQAASNAEPLLINTPGSWANRPEAVTRIGNLFLASDYVRTWTDVATMEAANEAARRAVNGILDASGSTQPPCRLWPLSEPAIFDPLKALDQARFDAGLGPILDSATLDVLLPPGGGR